MPAPDETEVVAAPLRGAGPRRRGPRVLGRGPSRCAAQPRADPARARAPDDAAPPHPRARRRRHPAGHRRGPDCGRTSSRSSITSGTTGAPKGVELTAAGRDVMGRGYSNGIGVTAADRWLACLPLHHVASLGVVARSYVTGVPYTVHDAFDIDRVARSPATEGTTIVSLVPTTLLRMLDAGAPLARVPRRDHRWCTVPARTCAAAGRSAWRSRRRRVRHVGDVERVRARRHSDRGRRRDARPKAPTRSSFAAPW